MSIINSFLIFNYNAFNRIAYEFTSNIWMVLSVIGVGIIITLSLKNVFVTTIREEQNVL